LSSLSHADQTIPYHAWITPCRFSTSAQNRLSIHANIGASFPVGKYANTNATEVVVGHPEFGDQIIIGISKHNNGFANTGFF